MRSSSVLLLLPFPEYTKTSNPEAQSAVGVNVADPRATGAFRPFRITRNFVGTPRQSSVRGSTLIIPPPVLFVRKSSVAAIRDSGLGGSDATLAREGTRGRLAAAGPRLRRDYKLFRDGSRHALC